MRRYAPRSTPLISVVIPTFNRSKLLGGALESLSRQTLNPGEYEVIVVDDGSSDETGETVDRYQSQVHVRYFRIANSGISKRSTPRMYQVFWPAM